MASRWGGHDGYLSPCGSAGECNVDVALRPDKEYTIHEPDSKLRDWIIMGGEDGTPVKNGDRVKIKATASRWGGHDGYLSPCGDAGICGINVTLRSDESYNSNGGESSNLRNWIITTSDKQSNNAINIGDIVQIKATASGWGGHDGYLSPCGDAGICGIGVTLRPDKEFTIHEPDSKLRDWLIEKVPVKEGFDISISTKAIFKQENINRIIYSVLIILLIYYTYQYIMNNK
jgi:hypothetical protein